MGKSRRHFLSAASLGLIAAACADSTRQSDGAAKSSEPTPGAPPAFGTAPTVGPAVSANTFAEAEKLMDVQLSQAEREQAVSNWGKSMAPLYERRRGPRKIVLEPTAAPYSLWNPVLPGQKAGPDRDRFVASKTDPAEAYPLPDRGDAIAFAPLSHLATWIQKRQLTSERLTNIYLDRIGRFDPKLRSIITVTRDLAISQAKKADQEIAAGKYRGPLHGIPWGVKDLVDTAGIATTYGAEPFRNRVPQTDRAIVQRLHDAGAVLIAKLSLGALALNDIWFGGQTMNPWVLEEGPAVRAPVPEQRQPRVWLVFQSAVKPAAALSIPRCDAESPGSAPRTAAFRVPAP